MNCPMCGKKTGVIDQSISAEENYRKRKCKSCGHKFYTIEYEIICDENFKEEWIKHHRSYVRAKMIREGVNT